MERLEIIFVKFWSSDKNQIHGYLQLQRSVHRYGVNRNWCSYYLLKEMSTNKQCSFTLRSQLSDFYWSRHLSTMRQESK